MLEALFVPYADLAMLALRVVIGIILIVHGYAKLFARNGPRATGEMFRQIGVPAPALLALVVGIVEFAGGLALVAGVATRLAALLAALVMIGALALVKRRVGFTRLDATGYEFDLALLAMALVLLTQGAGPTSLDARLGLGR